MEYNIQNKQARNDFIDFLKGLSIFFVLWGHCIQYLTLGQWDFFEDKAFIFIYSFHMPLFIMISGYLFYESCNKKNISNIIKI